jgi:hypothetical protein
MAKTQKEKLNEMARKFYAAHGYQVKKGYDFSEATHPQEQGMWTMAVLSFNYWSVVLKDK